jgi:RES domain-containing protein
LTSAWRIYKKKHVATALTGYGARTYGGRWNSAGRDAIYGASTPTLAILELLVHLESDDLLLAYELVEMTFDQRMVEYLDRSRLPTDWADPTAPVLLQQIGDEWLTQKRTLALAVPSALSPTKSEINFVINPLHPDFGKLVFGNSIPCRLDPRLK